MPKPQFKKHKEKHIYGLEKVDGLADVLIDVDGDKPKFRSWKWDNPDPRFPGCWLDVDVPDVTLSQTNKPKVHKDNNGNEKLRWECGKNGKTHHYEAYVGDSLDLDAVFTAKDQLPTETREDCFVLRFDVSHPLGLRWEYQDFAANEFTAEQIESGEYSRPDWAEDSYALYFNQAGRFTSPDGTELVNYEAGKYAHCKRTKIVIPKNATETEEHWGRMWKEGGQLLVGVPFDVVNVWNPSFGVLRVDPTFGYSTVGSSEVATQRSLGTIDSSYTHTATTGDTATGITFYARKTSAGDPDQTVYLGLYEVSGTPLMTNRTVRALTSAVSSTSQASYSVTISTSLSDGTTYGVASSDGTTGTAYRRYYDDTATGGGTDYSSFDDRLSDPYDHSVSIDYRLITQFAEYTVAPTGRVPYEYYHKYIGCMS